MSLSIQEIGFLELIPLTVSHKNGQNADLNHQNVEKARKGPKTNFPIASTDFYIQEY